MTSNIFKLLIADPNILIALGCEAVIKRSNAFKTHVATCNDVEDLIAAINLYCPDIVLVNPIIVGAKIDGRLAGKAQGNIVALLYSSMRSISLSGYRRSICIDMSTEEIINIICSIKEGDGDENGGELDEKTLSPREIDVVTLVAKGMTNKEIAQYLSISIHTVITHRRNIAKKLDIHSASGITIYAIVKKLVSIEETGLIK